MPLPWVLHDGAARALGSLSLLRDPSRSVVGCEFEPSAAAPVSCSAPRYALRTPAHSAPWAHVVQAQFAHISELSGVDLSATVHLLVTSLSPGTYSSYGSKFMRFVQFCASQNICPLPASTAAVVAYAVHLAHEGQVKAATAQPYFSAINRVHLDVFPDRDPPARDSHVLSAVRRGWERAQVAVSPCNVRLHFPAQVMFQVLQFALTLAPSQVSLLRACSAVIFDFITFVRSKTGMILPPGSVHVDVAALSLTYRPATLKTALLDGQSSRPVRIELSGMPAVAQLLHSFTTLAASAWRVAPAPLVREWFFQLPDDPAPFRPSLMNAFLSEVCACVQAAPPAGYTWSSHSSRASAATHAAAIGVPLARIEFMGSWSPGSASLRRIYIDPTVAPSPAAYYFFGWLLQPRWPLHELGDA